MQKLTSLIRSHLFIFPLFLLPWETDLRKHWYNLLQRNVFCIFKKIYLLFIYLFYFYFGLHRVLIAAHGGSSLRHAGSSLWCADFSLVAACGFSLSSCGAQAPGHMASVVVVRRFQSV